MFFSFFISPVGGQETFPQGGSSFSTAVEIKPGQYEGGKIDWEDETANKQYFYLSDVKSGQAVEAVIRFSGNTNLDVSLFDNERVKVAYVFGGDDIDPLVWLVGSETNTNKYYLVIENTAINIATDISLNLKVSDKYDANSLADAGSTIPKALLISPGTHQGYLSGEQGNDEKDFYNLKLKKGKRVSIKITPPSEDSIMLAVYDVNRAKLDENTSSDTGEIVTLSFIPANDGNYYLELYCGYGCDEVVEYQMEISGAVLPTGGGLITSETPEVEKPTTNPEVSLSPSSPPTTTNSLLANRDLKYLLIIAGTVLVMIMVVVLLLRKKPSSTGTDKTKEATENKSTPDKTDKKQK